MYHFSASEPIRVTRPRYSRLALGVTCGVGLIALTMLNACAPAPASISAAITQVNPTDMIISSDTPMPTLEPTSAQQTIEAIVERRFTQQFLTQGASTATQEFINIVDARVHLLQTATAVNAPPDSPTPTPGPTEQEIAFSTAVAARATEIAQNNFQLTQTAAVYATRDSIINPLLTATAQAQPTATSVPMDATLQQATLNGAIVKRQTEIAMQTAADIEYSTRVALVDPLLTATALRVANPTATLQAVREALIKNLDPLTTDNAGSLAEIATLPASTKAVSGLEFSPDGFTLGASTLDFAVQVYDVVSGTKLAAFIGNTDRLGVAFSPDSTLVAAPSSDGTVRVLDTRSGTERFVLEQPVNPTNGRRLGMTSVAFSPDGFRLAAGNADGTVTIWNMANGTKILTLTGPHGFAYGITSVRFTPDGAQVVAGNTNGQIALWESVTDYQTLLMPGDGSPVTGLYLSADSKTVISATRNNQVVIRDTATGNIKQTIKTIQATVTGIAVNADMSLIAVSNNDGAVRVYDIAGNKLIATLKGSTVPVTSLALSPDGFRLATGGEDGVIHVWAVTKTVNQP